MTGTVKTVKKANLPFSFSSLLSKVKSFALILRKPIFQRGKKKFNALWFETPERLSLERMARLVCRNTDKW